MTTKIKHTRKPRLRQSTSREHKTIDTRRWCTSIPCTYSLRRQTCRDSLVIFYPLARSRTPAVSVLSFITVTNKYYIFIVFIIKHTLCCRLCAVSNTMAATKEQVCTVHTLLYRIMHTALSSMHKNCRERPT